MTEQLNWTELRLVITFLIGKLMPNSLISVQFSSVQSLSCVRLCDHESQHARPPCPSPTPGVHSDSRPSSRWCHPAISSSVVAFSSCPQSLPASESFPMSQLFTWGGQSIYINCCCWVTKSCPTVCNPMDCSTPGSPSYAFLKIDWFDPAPQLESNNS